MKVVVADTSQAGAPIAIKDLIRQERPWSEIRPPTDFLNFPDLQQLDAGERAAIRLAQAEPEALLIIDDSAGRREAEAGHSQHWDAGSIAIGIPGGVHRTPRGNGKTHTN